MKIHIPGTCEVIIRAETETECRNTFAKMLGYKNFKQMEHILGKKIVNLDKLYVYEKENVK